MLDKFIAVVRIDEAFPLVALCAEFVQVEDVDAGGARTRLEVDDHAAIGGELAMACIASNRRFQMDEFVLCDFN